MKRKYIPILTTCALVAFSSTEIQAAPTKLITETVEFVLKKSGKAASPAAKLAAEEALKEAAVRHGDNVLAYVRSGGSKALIQGKKYGDEFWALCKQYPDDCVMLANKADSLIPLARKAGTEVIELERKVPGLAQELVEFYGVAGTKTLVKSSPDELAKLYSLAKNNPTQAKQFFAKHSSTPGFLQSLSGTQLLGLGGGSGLLATGIGGGVAAHEVGDGIQDGLKTLSKESPATFSVSVALMVGFATLAFFIVFRQLFFRLFGFLIPKKRTPAKKTDQSSESVTSTDKKSSTTAEI